LSSNADKQEIRCYLLGTLDSDRKTELEERLLFAPETYEEVVIVENELLDQYVAGGLNELERQQFETNFLITAERHKDFRFAQLLKRYVTSHVNPGAPAKKPFTFSMLPAAGRPLIAFSIAGVTLLGIVLLGWIVGRRPITRSVQKSAEPVVVVTLAPGSFMSEGVTMPRVNVPPKGYNLKLELELANPRFRNYKWELFRENKSMQTSGELRSEAKGQQFVVPLTISGEILPGDYQVKLSGVSESGADEFIQNYSFRVIE